MLKKAMAMLMALGLMTACFTGCSGGGSESDEEVTVMTNAKIYTEADGQEWADTIVIKGDTIEYVGNDADGKWQDIAGDDAKVEDMGGAVMLPGMCDAHTHPSAVMMSSWHVNLPWTYDKEELLNFVKEYCEEHPVEEVPFFYGDYYPSDLFGEEGPTKELLDQYVSDRPVMLKDFSEHAGWLNSKALELMGVDKNTEDPTPGLDVFVRDAEGNPTGWYKEHAFKALEEKLYDAIDWHPPTEITEKMMTDYVQQMNDWGYTSLLEAYILDESTMKVLKKMDEEGKLNINYSACVYLESYDELEEVINTAKDYREKYNGGHIIVDTIKYFFDGTNEVGTSAVLEPFSNDPEGKNRGTLDMSEEELTKTLVRLNEEGFDIQIHLVGDRAFRVACNATEAAKKQAGDDWNIQVELLHNELVDEADMGRPAELGIIINWSPHWTGGYFGLEAKNYLGEERFNKMYDFTKMIESGAVVNYGSDVVTNYEFHRANPFFGMQCAVTRIDPEFPLDVEGHMRPLESSKLTVPQLIDGYTKAGAIELRLEDSTGSLEAGKKANLCVLNQNVFEVPEDKIMDVKPTLVMFEGKIVSGAFK